MSDYQEVLIETIANLGEPAAERIRARPVAGQGYSDSMRVECSSRMRKSHAVGTKFLIQARLTDREGGKPFLYCHYSWPYRVLTEKEAQAYLQKRKRDAP